MAQADNQDLAMEQDPEDVMFQEEEEVAMDRETQEHVYNELQASDVVQAVAAELSELDKATDVELQEAEVIQVDDMQVPMAEMVQVTGVLQEDKLIQSYSEIMPVVGDKGHSGEWMQDGKSVEGQADSPVQIPDLDQVEKGPEVNVQCR